MGPPAVVSVLEPSTLLESDSEVTPQARSLGSSTSVYGTTGKAAEPLESQSQLEVRALGPELGELYLSLVLHELSASWSTVMRTCCYQHLLLSWTKWLCSVSPAVMN